MKKCAIYARTNTYRKVPIWEASRSCSLMILALMGYSEITTLLLRSCVVVKTEYFVSCRRAFDPPGGAGDRTFGFSWLARPPVVNYEC